MTILKSTDAATIERIRPVFGMGTRAGEAGLWKGAAGAEVAVTREQHLQERIDALEAEVASHGAALEDAFAKGEAAGRSAAEDEFVQDQAAALEALKAALLEMRSRHSEALQSFETLALAGSVAAIEKMIGDPDRYRGLLQAAIAHQTRQLDLATVVTVEVSRLDFPDTRDVAALEADLGDLRRKLLVRDDYDAGACRIRLTVGSLEIGLPLQWSAIRSMFEQLGGALQE